MANLASHCCIENRDILMHANKPLEEDQHVPGTILPQHGRPRDMLQLSSLLAVKLASFSPDLIVT